MFQNYLTQKIVLGVGISQIQVRSPSYIFVISWHGIKFLDDATNFITKPFLKKDFWLADSEFLETSRTRYKYFNSTSESFLMT